MSPLELWGGVECTINRVGDIWYDQLEHNGHRGRIQDLDLFATLGIRRLRQPVLWETHAHDGDWAHTDAALARLRALDVEPIVGLLHHGSGPRGTSLVDAGFAEGLAAHAARVAARHPWVETYTPINEPLTTARFSGLYGLWYPHGRDDHTFARALVNQCRAIVLSMRAIRAVNPAAKLVQTDDIGKAFSTPPLAYQAELENERRWLAWDLLCGRVELSSPGTQLLLRAGIGRAELGWFADNPCPPDIIGVNHYVTSDRFLDHRIERYPHLEAGGNGRDRYVDIEAVRAVEEHDDGWARCLEEAWQRYRLPLAITEAHLGCTRDEQLRWFAAAWSAAARARDQGCDVRAVTAWALLGSRDWNSLLTRHVGHYESGIFDLRGGRPRATALAAAIRELAKGEHRLTHPAAGGPGWWQRPERLLSAPRRAPQPLPLRRPRRPVLITGAAGNLGRALVEMCRLRGLEYRTCTHQELDICSPGAIAATLETLRPWAVINAAGYVRVDQAEGDSDRCFRDNFAGPAALAQGCEALGIRLATFSSDLVFDGRTSTPYLESSPVAPLNVYGASKACAEREVLRLQPQALVIRTSSFFGPWHPHDFLPVALRALNRRERFVAMDDVIASHTYVPDLANGCLDLLIDAESGLWHLANEGPMSWLEFARRGARLAGVDARSLEGRACCEFRLAACRPAFSALATERGYALAPLEDALQRFVRQAGGRWSVAA